MIFSIEQTIQIANMLSNKKIGVLPTDTIYGLHCLAQDEDLIKRVYDLKQRPYDQPVITIISSVDQLNLFELEIGKLEQDYIKKFWPGPNTLILKQKKGGTRSFRIPHNAFLIKLISQTGALISTSANIHGGPLTETIEQAQEIFGDDVDFYVNGGRLSGKSSTVYDLTKENVDIVRF